MREKIVVDTCFCAAMSRGFFSSSDYPTENVFYMQRPLHDRIIKQNKAHGNGTLFFQQMMQQTQARLKQAQVTAIGAMDDRHPAIPLGDGSQIDDPDVGQTHGNQQACQPFGIGNVALSM